MSAYRVYFTVTAETWVDVEADDPEDAVDIAAHRDVYVPLCHQCVDHIELSEDFEPTSVFDQETNEKVWPPEESL